jgi:hypothetical protein
MKCINCGSGVIYVLDSRPAEIDGLHTTRRRRICRECKFRWSTIEVLLGERRRHDAIGILNEIRDNLQRTLTKIDELSRGEGNEKS